MRWINCLAIPACCLLLAACSSWQRPPAIDESVLRQQATEMQAEGVVVRARVLSPQESLQVVGVDLIAQDIQPVWVEVDNGSGQDLALLQSGADPEYFSPLEVSWTLHTWAGKRNNAAVDEHLQSVAWRRGPIPAGSSRSGLLFTNPHRNQKLLNIDLLGEQRFLPFTLIVPVPDEQGRISEAAEWPYLDADMVNYQREQNFREALKSWYADTLPEVAEGLTQPLSLVWVGRRLDLGSALVRRGYRLEPLEHDLKQTLMGRPPDFVLRKSARRAPANWIRMWALPMTFQGRPVLVAQAGAPIAGRFAPGPVAQDTDPAVDEARDMLVQDLLYSGGIIKLAIAHPQPGLDIGVASDGRVGVLFVAARPLLIADARIVDWAKVDWSREPDPYSHRAVEKE